MNEICPVYKGMLDPIITSYKLTTCQLLIPQNTYNTLLILLTINSCGAPCKKYHQSDLLFFILICIKKSFFFREKFASTNVVFVRFVTLSQCFPNFLMRKHLLIKIVECFSKLKLWNNAPETSKRSEIKYSSQEINKILLQIFPCVRLGRKKEREGRWRKNI